MGPFNMNFRVQKNLKREWKHKRQWEESCKITFDRKQMYHVCFNGILASWNELEYLKNME
jgi:hypothetical protein